MKNNVMRYIQWQFNSRKNAARLKCDWVDHIIRMHDGQWATVWVSEDGRRRRGCPDSDGAMIGLLPRA